MNAPNIHNEKNTKSNSKRSDSLTPVLEPTLMSRMHETMVEARALEERLIRMQRGGDGYFWIGGPGEEAFNVALGTLVKKGEGPDHDYLHLHYRSSATMLAMGIASQDAIRQMKSVATDPFSGGRNFVGHFSKREWNIAPISSPIEVQYTMAIGSAYTQKRHGGDGITIVQGGDAGTAEGDFASCLVWCSRPGAELPALIIVTNNSWGISTPASTQHGEQHISDRGKAFGIKTKTINGNDLEEAYAEISMAMEYVRKERKPFLLEAHVSRLYGHSSSSGSNFVDSEVDCLKLVEQKLSERGIRSLDASKALHESFAQRMNEYHKQALTEPVPTPESIWDHVFADQNLIYPATEQIKRTASDWAGKLFQQPQKKGHD